MDKQIKQHGSNDINNNISINTEATDNSKQLDHWHYKQEVKFEVSKDMQILLPTKI